MQLPAQHYDALHTPGLFVTLSIHYNFCKKFWETLSKIFAAFVCF